MNGVKVFCLDIPRFIHGSYKHLQQIQNKDVNLLAQHYLNLIEYPFYMGQLSQDNIIALELKDTYNRMNVLINKLKDTDKTNELLVNKIINEALPEMSSMIDNAIIKDE